MDTTRRLFITNSQNAITVLADEDPQPIDIPFPIDTYDGIISSTHYTYLDEEMTVAFVSFFNNLKIHNQEVENLDRLREQSSKKFIQQNHSYQSSKEQTNFC